MGAKFASSLNDTSTSVALSTAADAVVASFPLFWDSNRNIILYEYGPVLHNKTSFKDIAVVLGVLHGYIDDGLYSPTKDQVLATAYGIATSFLDIYPIANVTNDPAGGTLGIPIGWVRQQATIHPNKCTHGNSRYPEDVYNGVGTAPSGGNPWFLATAAMAELFYLAAAEFQSNGNIAVTNTSLPFWQFFAPSASLAAGQTYVIDSAEFGAAISGLEGWADAFMRRVKYHEPADGRFAEEYNRDTGNNTGAQDLTWSYASILTAAFARAKLRNDDGYVTDVANSGFGLDVWASGSDIGVTALFRD